MSHRTSRCHGGISRSRRFIRLERTPQLLLLPLVSLVLLLPSFTIILSSSGGGGGSCSAFVPLVFSSPRAFGVPHRRCITTSDNQQDDCHRRMRLCAKATGNHENADAEPPVNNNTDDEDQDSSAWLASLQQRIRQSEATQLNWRRAQCHVRQVSSTIMAAEEVPRLVSVDYPVAACGHHDEVVVLHLEQQPASGHHLLARTCTGILLRRDDNNKDDNNPVYPTISWDRVRRVQERLRLFRNEFSENNNHRSDEIYTTSGEVHEPVVLGDILAVALEGSYLCEARITGGVHVHRLSRDVVTTAAAQQQHGSMTLVSQGLMVTLNHGVLVTALQIQNGILWVATDQGFVDAYILSNDDTDPNNNNKERLPLTLRQPDQRWQLDGKDTIFTSLTTQSGGTTASVTSDQGRVYILSLGRPDHNNMVECFLPPFVRPGIFPTCATLVATKRSHSDNSNSNNHDYDLVCGANDGSMSVHALGWYDDDDADDLERLVVRDEIPVRGLERHWGPVQSLTSPAPGLLLSCGDGTLRLTDLDDHDDDSFLYHIPTSTSSTNTDGLGSVWTDGSRIVAGTATADHSLTVYDFTADLDDDVVTRNINNNKNRGRSTDRDRNNNNDEGGGGSTMV